MSGSRRQHVVSQVILRQWAVKRELDVVDLVRGTTRRRSPKAEGFVPWFVRSDYSAVIEALWSEVEQCVPRVLELVRQRKVFDDADAIVTLKSLLAMHIIRAQYTQLMWAESLTRHADAGHGHLANLRDMANEPSFLAGLYRDLTGLYPTGPGALHLARERLLANVERVVGVGGDAFVEHLLLQHQALIDFLGARSIEIGVATCVEAEFVIGDNPAATYNHDRQAAGLRAGVSIEASDTILLPLDHRHVLAAGGKNTFVDMGVGQVHQVNAIQIVTAAEKLYCRPGSGMADWVLQQRNLILIE